MDHDHHSGSQSGYQDSHGNWVSHNTNYSNPPSQHQSPAQEYGAFSFAPLPVEPMYHSGMHPPRTSHQMLEPLIMPQWPSMLTSQSTYIPPIFSSSVPVAHVSTPLSATPVSATSSRSTSNPRKTLTDTDRRNMCLYHEEHPNTKQAEIGQLFGVERSTVSKVLRQKEKFLYQEDGSRSPIKRSKGKFPDIERALSNWARNHVKKGLPISDEMIREKARFFASTVGNIDTSSKTNSSSWLEKFKQKNNLPGAKSRKNSLAAEDVEDSPSPALKSQTPNEFSPVSPGTATSPSPVLLSSSKSEEHAIKRQSSAGYMDFSKPHRPFHSQSSTSLSSAFTDAAQSTFSAGPTSPGSPIFTPDSTGGPSPYPLPPTIGASQAGSNLLRTRSQTFPMLGIETHASSPPPASDASTPKFYSASALDSPPSDLWSKASRGADERKGLGLDVSSMQPPPLPRTAASPGAPSPRQHSRQRRKSHGSGQDSIQKQKSQQRTPKAKAEAAVSATPSPEEARKALELLMTFFEHQPSGFVEPQEYVTIGKLMEKLRLQTTRSPVPSGSSKGR